MPAAPKPKKSKVRRCKNCKNQFTPKYNPMQNCCGVDCAYEWARGKPGRDAKKAQKAKRLQWAKDKREFRERDRKLQLKLCKDAVNWYVKYVQEVGKGCYTCDDPLTINKADAGHWLTVGAHPEKRFDTIHNIRKQCVDCNQYNGGRPDVFEKNLRAELGDEVVDEFVASKPPKLTTAEVVELKKKYLRLNRMAKKAMEDSL